jgi:hypothetical protein
MVITSQQQNSKEDFVEKLYREFKDGESRTSIQRLSDSAFIPLDPANSDYAEFLRLCEEHGEDNILIKGD